MEAEAKAPKNGCLTQQCEHLSLTAKYEDEQKMLAALYDAMCSGGVILVARLGHKDLAITFPKKE